MPFHIPSLFLGACVTLVLVALVGLFTSSGRFSRKEDRDVLEATVLRDYVAEVIKSLGLTQEFPEGYDLGLPFFKYHAALEKIQSLEARIQRGTDYQAIAAAENDARRLARALENRIRAGWPMDVDVLMALSTYKRRKGIPNGKSPRLN